MGLTTEDTARMVHPDNIRQVEFRSVIAEARQLVPELRRKADVVIAATHMAVSYTHLDVYKRQTLHHA